MELDFFPILFLEIHHNPELFNFRIPYVEAKENSMTFLFEVDYPNTINFGNSEFSICI